MTNLENPISKDNPEIIDTNENLIGIEKDLNGLETKIKADDFKNSVEKGKDPEPGKFLKCRESRDGFIIYKYKIKSGGTPEGIRAQAVIQKIAKNKKGIEITDIHAKKYQENHRFGKNEVVFVRVPKETIEKDIKIIDGVKCKGGEYFGIDVSSYNKRGREELSKRNEENRDNFEKSDVRGISFIYIKAGDGVPNAISQNKSIEEWLKFIKEHNNKSRTKEQHEQISAGFYWLLSNKTNAITQADKYVEIYNKYKNQLGLHELIPMLDLETNRFNEVKKFHKDKKTGKTVIDERYTPKEFCNNALKWLQYVEKKTGIVPGIYTGPVVYEQYIEHDRRFDRYRKNMWISAYGGTRIDHKKGTVAVGNGKNKHNIKSTMYQSSQNGDIPGVGNSNNRTDMDHTKDITKLFSKNNKSKTGNNPKS